MLVFCCFFVLAFSGGVEELNEWTLGYINNGEPWLVVFYTPWCQFCQALLPVVDRVSSSSSFRVARFDCSGSRAGLCAELGFEAWPALAAVRGHRAWIVEGGRDEEGLVRLGDKAAQAKEAEAGERLLTVPSRAGLLAQRARKEAEVALEDLATLYERYDDSVVLLALAGVVVGVLLGAATWREKQKRE